MKTFMCEDFLLENEISKELYHKHAKIMPIYDYHCHLSPKEIADNQAFSNMTQVWLKGDHYKWRAMRSFGIEENAITGHVSDYEKFKGFVDMLPYTIGNPMYHWSHLELKKYFDIDKPVNDLDTKELWDTCNNQLDHLTPHKLIEMSQVKVICTTDDPVDTLEDHDRIKESSLKAKVLPTYRPDKAIKIENEAYLEYIKLLEAVSGHPIKGVDDVIKALTIRMDFFHDKGCRVSDHALDTVEYLNDDDLAEQAFKVIMNGENLSDKMRAAYKGKIMRALASHYHKRNWVMQLHIGAQRNNNKRLFETMGPDTGFDSICDQNFSIKLAELMSDLDIKAELPKTILYTLDPSYNYVIGTMIGNFQGGGIKGKIQFGSGWWFNDQKDGMIEQLKALSNLGLLSTFVGMLTDSRSLLSYTRHEYFRRILCQFIGDMVMKGEYPHDMKLLGKIVEDICYNNAVNYFDIEV
ncbi:glucuronate isomerase [Acidaminobacter sp. JC074]|uniref:glucuronate isomerase n=1 Tax=Acidaminobacter sp. JC074 TaxID=2530199 RepID=UPI001F1118E5|nr:glucuronate isomerase [Acidaminobacter sp. JC074]MCH4887012.1 glucuronate isomerase [Acidaminobacter sp. JC074]